MYLRLGGNKNEDMSQVCCSCFKYVVFFHIPLFTSSFLISQVIHCLLNCVFSPPFYFSSYLVMSRMRNMIIFGNCSEKLSRVSSFPSHIYGFVEEWLVISGVFFLLLPDILYLNKQRLVAIEELNKTNGEKQLLLNKIKKLEAEKQAGAGKGDRSWHVLLYFIQHIR